MPATDTRNTLRKLVEIQDLDKEILRTQAALDRGPELLGQRGQRLRDLEAKLAAHQQATNKRRILANEAELNVRTREATIKKFAQQLNVAKSNQEYRALRDQITRLEGEQAQAEDTGLRLLEDVEKDEEIERGLISEVDAARSEFAAFEHQLEEDLTTYRSELEEMRGRREVLVAGTDMKALASYERIRAVRDGVAVAVIEGGVCQGCFMSVTKNDILKVRTGQTLVSCASCQRILYLPDLIQ